MKHATRFLLMLVGCAVLFSLFTPVASADFNPSNLIDDSIYENTSSMTAGQIDAFLNSFPQSCISYNNGFTTADPTGWSASVSSNHGYTFGGNVSAGQAISDAAHIYGLNPQVILATLQKEQSVVTGSAGCHYSNPSPGMACTYSGGGCVFIAMSYACPGGCDASYDGFSLQLIAGSWLLRFAEQRAYGNLTGYVGHDPGDENINYSGPMTAGTRQRSASAPAIYYDGTYTTQDGTSVTITDGGTAALYYYTPFISGNRSFDSLFQSWFGPTVGTILLKGSSSTVYIQGSDPNVLYGIPSGAVLQAYGLQNIGVTPVSDSFISSRNTSSILTTLFMRPNDGTIYLADHGHMSGIASGAVCTQWGLPCSSANLVATLPTYLTNTLTLDHPLGNLMLNNNTIFLINNDTKQPFIGPSDLANSPYTGQSPTGIQSPLNSSQPSGIPAFYSSQFFKIGNSGSIYYYNYPNNQYFSFSSFDSFKNWWDGSPASQDWFSSFNNSPPATTTATDFVTNNGTTYLVSGATAYTFPSAPSTPALDTATYPGLKSLLLSKPVTAVASSLALRVPSGSFFSFQSGQLDPIPTLTDLSLLFSPSHIYNVPAALNLGYQTGKFDIPSGRVVKVSGGQAIYVYGSDQNLWGIPTAGQVNAVLRWADNVLETPASNINSAGTKLYASMVQVGGNYYAIEVDGAARPIPSALLSSQKDNVAMPLTNPIVGDLVADNKAVQFIHFDNGTIFAVQGSVIRPLSQFSTYATLGGTAANTLELPSTAWAAFNIGSPLS